MNASIDHTADQDTAGTRSAKLRRMLLSPRLEFLMEAHNGLSARVVREAGFSGDLGLRFVDIGPIRRARQ